MKTCKVFAYVLASVLALGVATPTLAQQPPPEGARTESSSTSTTSHHGATRRVVAVTRDIVTGGYRTPTFGDNSMGVAEMDTFVREYVAANRTDGSRVSESERRQLATAAFEQLEQQQVSGCGEAGEWIREHLAIAAEVHANQIAVEGDAARIDPLLIELARLRSTQNTGNLGAGGGALAQALGSCAAGGFNPLSCGGSLLAALGYGVQLDAHGKTQRLDRNMRDLDLRQRDTHTSMASTSNRAHLANARMSIGWARRFHAYCMTVLPNQTSGINNIQVDPAMFSWNYGR